MVIKKQNTKRVAIILIALFLTLMGFVWWYLEATNKGPFSEKMITSLHFPLYYPTKLPDGLTSSSASINDGRVAVVTYKNNTGGQLFMSEEAKPTGFNFDSFYQSIISNRKIHTKQADAYAGMLPDKTKTIIINMVTAKTWVIMNTQLNLSTQQVNDLVTSIRAVNGK